MTQPKLHTSLAVENFLKCSACSDSKHSIITTVSFIIRFLCFVLPHVVLHGGQLLITLQVSYMYTMTNIKQYYYNIIAISNQINPYHSIVITHTHAPQSFLCFHYQWDNLLARTHNQSRVAIKNQENITVQQYITVYYIQYSH
jgi:hypothetical protein